MRKFQFLSTLVILMSILLSACGATAPATEVMMDKPTEAMMSQPTDAMMSNPTMTPDAMMSKETAVPGAMMNETATPEAMMGASTPGAMMGTPAWYGVSLTDASSGKTFKVDDYRGKVVLVEIMAI